MKESEKPNNELEQTALSVGGMSCAACVVRVERALAEIEGVEKAAVNFATEKAQVTPDPGKVDLEKLRKAIEEAGYQFRGLARAKLRDREREERRQELNRLKKKIRLQRGPWDIDHDPVHAPHHPYLREVPHQILYPLCPDHTGAVLGRQTISYRRLGVAPGMGVPT